MSKTDQVQRDAKGCNFFLEQDVQKYAKLQDGRSQQYYKAYIDEYVKQGLIDYDSWHLYQHLLAMVVYMQDKGCKWELTYKGIATATTLSEGIVKRRVKKMIDAGLISLVKGYDLRENGKPYKVFAWYFHKPKTFTTSKAVESVGGGMVATAEPIQTQEVVEVVEKCQVKGKPFDLASCEGMTQKYNGIPTAKNAGKLQTLIATYQRETRQEPTAEVISYLVRVIDSGIDAEIRTALQRAIAQANIV